MKALTHIRGTQVAVLTELPNTLIAVDPVHPPAVPNDVELHILDELVMPLVRHFRGGTPMGDREASKQREELVELLIGYEPEAYGICARIMRLERRDPFFPVDAVIIEYLQKAQDRHYEAGGQVRQLERLQDELYAVICGRAWDEKRLGPAPGKPGCRLTDDDVLAALRKHLKRDPLIWDLQDVRRDEVQTYSSSTGDPEVGPHIRLRRVRRASKGLGFDLIQRPAYQPLLVELGVPIKPDEVAAAEAEFAQWEKERYLGILRKDIETARSNLRTNVNHRDSEGADRSQVNVDAALARLDKSERALAELEDHDMAAWDAERAARREAEKAAMEVEHRAAEVRRQAKERERQEANNAALADQIRYQQRGAAARWLYRQDPEYVAASELHKQLLRAEPRDHHAIARASAEAANARERVINRITRQMIEDPEFADESIAAHHAYIATRPAEEQLH